MADNVAAEAVVSAGATFATDDDGSAHHPYVKVEFGADNTQTPVDASNPLPVALSGTDNAVLDTIDAVLDLINAKLVSGTIIGDVNLSATDNGVLDTIDAVLDTINAKLVTGTVIGDVNVVGDALTALQLLDNAISGTEMQVDVVAALPAGANLVGDVGISGARTSGGTTFFHDADLDETKVEVKATAGQLYWFHVMNMSAVPLYLQIFDLAAASVTVGTTVPGMEFIIPTLATTNGAGFVLAIPNGIAMGTGITIACTTDSEGSAAPGASACSINLGYA